MNSIQEKEDTSKSLQQNQSQRKHNKKIQQAQNLTKMTDVYVASMQEKTQKSCVEIQWLTLYNMITIIWGKWGTIHCSASNVGKEAFIGGKIRDPV